jgi:hypothetical protein
VTKWNKYIWIGLSVVAGLAAVAVIVLAGNPDGPPGPPESTYSYTLEDIYRRLDTGAPGTPITFTEPISGPGTGTMHTLDDIMGVAPAVDDANGAVQEDVLAGRTAWGLTGGAWGAMTGTMPDNGAAVYTPSTITQAIAMGYHDGSGYVVGDTDLVSGNVRGGVSLFGVGGDPNVVDTSSGDAVSGEILTGTAAWVDGVEVSGTMPNNGAVTIVPTTTAQTVAAGYHNGAGTVEGDTDLVAGSIAQGVDLFGVIGICRGVPGTGQTVSYGTGDDGAYQLGCRPAVAPQSGYGGAYNRGFTDNGDGTVTDNLTGLIWLKDASNWTTALSAANGLADGTCGLSDSSSAGDWRLPNVHELTSLIDPGQVAPALPVGHPFTGVQSDVYWSSTTYANITSSAWFVGLNFGSVSDVNKSYAYYVWPVRGGQ